MEDDKTASFNDDWIWHTIIYRMCQELNYIPDRVYDLAVTAVLDWMSFFKEKEDYQQKLADKERGITRY